MRFRSINRIFFILSALVFLISSCNTTRHVKDGEYMLRSNSIKLKSENYIPDRGTLKDNLSQLVQQKPNTYSFFGMIPWKLIRYNNRYEVLTKDTSAELLANKKVEPPVIYDSSLKNKSYLSMKNFMFHKGYFYAQISDTAKFKKKKAFVSYTIKAGTNYLINNIELDIKDSVIKTLITKSSKESFLKPGTDFSYDLLDEEMNRLSALMLEHGYYRFSNDNIHFVLDTLNKKYIKESDKTLAGSIDAVLQNSVTKPALNIQLSLTDEDNPLAFKKHAISTISVYPDFRDAKDINDSALIVKKTKNATFRYHKYYVRESVLQSHIFLGQERYYSQGDYDLTITKLNELGIFQSVQIVFRDDSTREPGWLKCYILLSPANKMDFNTGFELSQGTTYALGNALNVSVRNKNLFKGANSWITSVTGALETSYDTSEKVFVDKFKLYTRSAGISSSIILPKFLVPLRQSLFSIRNTPRTVITTGFSVLDRVKYFTLFNLTSSITYQWKETHTKSWEVTPIFISNMRIPESRLGPAFIQLRDSNPIIKKTYKNTFIEGESISFIFSDREKKKDKNYSFAKISFEEAGGLVGLMHIVDDSILARYVKFDADLQHFITRAHSMVALRLYTGIGLPYGKTSSTLPYVKQYYVGGSYSIRGWKLRSLGPGRYYDTNAVKSTSYLIDRTGDIKLELNAEYRFDMLKLVGGSIKVNGALFSDAGNIWMAHENAGYKGGGFKPNQLGNDLAISSGAGIRFDIMSFVVLRFDLAFPVKTPIYPDKSSSPYYPAHSGWMFKYMAFGSSQWRRDNLNFNIAIGYPF